MADYRRWISRVPPKEEMRFVVIVPARNFPNSARVAGYVTLKDSPKGQTIFVNFAFFSKDIEEARSEEFTRPLVCISTTV